MAVVKNPLEGASKEEILDLFSRLSYKQLNGVQRDVEFIGNEERVLHGLGFTPDINHLTVRVHLAQADIGQVYVTRVDDEYVYVRAPRRGKVRLEISHPPSEER